MKLVCDLGIVEEEKWEFAADGVAGGIEKWRLADAEKHRSDYLPPRSWRTDPWYMRCVIGSGGCDATRH